MPLGAVQFDGLRPGRLEPALFGTALCGVGPGRDLLPELFVVVGVGIEHVGVDMGRKGDPGRPVERRDGVFHDAQFAARQREETHRLDRHLDAVFQHDPHAARQHRTAHVRLAVKALHLRDGRQVERLAVDPDVDPDPERGVRDLGEILRIAVLPPSHAGLVGIVDPADVVARKRRAGIALLEIGPAAHHAVAQREERFGSERPRRIEAILDEAPGVGFYVVVHNLHIVLYRLFHRIRPQPSAAPRRVCNRPRPEPLPRERPAARAGKSAPVDLHCQFFKRESLEGFQPHRGGRK